MHFLHHFHIFFIYIFRSRFSGLFMHFKMNIYKRRADVPRSPFICGPTQDLRADLGCLCGILLLPLGDLAAVDQLLNDLVDDCQQLLIALFNADTVLLDLSYGSTVLIDQREHLETAVVVEDDLGGQLIGDNGVDLAVREALSARAGVGVPFDGDAQTAFAAGNIFQLPVADSCADAVVSVPIRPPGRWVSQHPALSPTGKFG